MAQNPKFKPNETPIENYQQGVVNWSTFKAKFDKPIGPDQKQYDPYYMYSVVAAVGDQAVDHIWFVNVDEHRVIQKAGTTKDSVMVATYVRDGKRRGLVVMHSSGPKANRNPEAVDAEVDAELAGLAGDLEMNVTPFDQPIPNVMLGPQMPTFPPPPQGSVPKPAAPTPPQIPQASQAGSQLQGNQQPTPKPPPSYSEDYGRQQKVYTPMSDVEMNSFQTYWRDLAKLHVWAYNELPKIAAELGLPKVKPSDQRELATSVTIETWRQMGRGTSPLVGWIIKEIPPDLTTRDGALRAIDKLDPADFPDTNKFVRRWLEMMVPASKKLHSWKHAANIAKLLGLDAEVLYNEHDSDHLMLLTQAIWMYDDARDELTRNEALQMIAEEFGLPTELMDFEEEIEEDDEESSELPEPVF